MVDKGMGETDISFLRCDQARLPASSLSAHERGGGSIPRRAPAAVRPGCVPTARAATPRCRGPSCVRRSRRAERHNCRSDSCLRASGRDGSWPGPAAARRSTHCGTRRTDIASGETCTAAGTSFRSPRRVPEPAPPGGRGCSSAGRSWAGASSRTGTVRAVPKDQRTPRALHGGVGHRSGKPEAPASAFLWRPRQRMHSRARRAVWAVAQPNREPL